MLENKTKKMAELEAKIEEGVKRNEELNSMLDRLGKYKPEYAPGQQALTEAKDKIVTERDQVRTETMKLRHDLEVATVAMLAGDDTDFAEPTPREALRSA